MSLKFIVELKGKRHTVNVTPMAPLQKVIEDVCFQQKPQLDVSSCRLYYQKKLLDPTTPVRFANLPKEAKLELVTDQTQQRLGLTDRPAPSVPAHSLTTPAAEPPPPSTAAPPASSEAAQQLASPAVMEAAAAAEASTRGDTDLPADFYDFTPDDYQKVMSGWAKKNSQAAGPLKTQKLREQDERRRAEQFGPVPVRIHFPDDTIVQAEFKPLEPLSVLQKLVQQCIQPELLKWYMYVTPPKQVLKDLSLTVYKAGLLPAANVLIGVESKHEGPFLKPDVAALQAPPPARSISQTESNGAEARKGPAGNVGSGAQFLSSSRVAGSENLLHAFPPAFPEETVEQQGLRQKACGACWTALSQHLEAVLEQTNYATFQALLQFAATAHQDPNSSNSFAQRRRIIPTALTFAGGVNSADHAQTFPALVNLLRQQGCYAAILHPSQLPSGKGVSSAVNSVLCQFSGLETEADDMLALLAWYQDILADPASNRVSPARPPATPFGNLQLTTPVKTTRSTAAAAAAAAANSEVSPEGSVTSPLAKLGINTPTAKGKRDKLEAEQAEEEVLAASERPLVVVIEEAEAVDTLTLQDLILVLSEAHAELPIVLVLGMATSAGALQQMLPVAAASMLEPQHFQLTSSMERFEAVVRDVLLGHQFPGIFFGHSVMRFINHQFMTHDFTTAVLRKGLQVACIAHFQQVPLSHLAPALMSTSTEQQLKQLLQQLPKTQAAFVKQQFPNNLPKEASSAAADMTSHLQTELRATCTARTAWAVALRWLNLAATVCDGKPRLAHTLRVLYLDASSAKYAGSQGKKRMLDQLCSGIARLSIEQCIHLLKGLSDCAEQVWEGSKVMQQDQQLAQALIIELQAGSPTKENQPSSQHMPAASPPSGPQPAKAPGPSRPALAPSRRNAQHSSAANKQAAMRQQMEESKASAKAAKDAKAVVSWQTTMASKVADMLRSIVDRALDTPPAATPGAAILCCGKLAASELHCLTAAPRLAIHEALATPHKYLGTPYELGLSSKMDDACIAYQLFLEYGESVDVADWFSGFCAVHDSSDRSPEEEAQAAVVPKLKKRRGRPSKKVLQRDEQEQPEASASAAAATGGMSRAGSKATRSTPAAESSQATDIMAAKTRRSRLANVTSATDQAAPSNEQQAAAVAAPASTARPRRHASNKANTDQSGRSSEPDDAAASGPMPAAESAPAGDAELEGDEAEAAAEGKSMEELAVRFSQATKELQVLGLLRPARKRRGDFAQKLVFHSGHVDMEV
ncbi:hypothetical protein WJX82_004745 [Trebouxia sp. C0006]